MTLQELIIKGEQFFDKETGELVPNVVPVGTPGQILVHGYETEPHFSDDLEISINSFAETHRSNAKAYVKGILNVRVVDPYTSMLFTLQEPVTFACPCQFYRIPE
nr:hypothetical protein [Nanoarchaeum sp.]